MDSFVPATTPSELATELDVDAKRIRAWLREQGFRSRAELGQQWQLSHAQAAGVGQEFGTSTLPISPNFDPRRLTVGEILHAYSSLLAELRRRGLVRTNNAPIGDLAEYACAAYYEGELAANSEKSYDLLAADGRRVQVKVRNVCNDTHSSATFSSIRSTDFDVCVFILANPDTNLIEAAYEWTAKEVLAHGKFRSHTNSTVIRIGKVRAGVAGLNITDGFNTAWLEMLKLVD